MRLFARYASLGVLILAAPAWSQDIKCTDAETITDCANRLIFQHVQELREHKSEDLVDESATEAVKEDQAGTSTGTGTAGSTFTDLLPWFNALGLLSDSDASDGTVAFDLNFLLLQSKKKATHNSQLKWVVDVSPEPFEPLIAALPEDVKDERTKSLEDDISGTGDSEIQYTYSVVNQHFGRDFRPHFYQMSSLIAPGITAASTPGENALRARAQANFGAKFNALRDGLIRPGEPGTAVVERVMRDFHADERAKIEEFINEQRGDLSVEMAKHLDAIAAVVVDPGTQSSIDALMNLVLLQPQLTFSVNHQIRDELVGPESTGIKVTFEKSFIDFNAFLKTSGPSCAPLKTATNSSALTAEQAGSCLKSIGRYVEQNAEDLENESRWKASVEYKQVDKWQYSLPDDGVAIDRPKYDRIVATAGFGRALPRTKAVKDRVDFEASYDSNLDSDDNYKSRFVATLTYTRRFNDMDIPFSIVYANKSEFLEGTDKQIGLHVGVKFRAVDAGK